MLEEAQMDIPSRGLNCGCLRQAALGKALPPEEEGATALSDCTSSLTMPLDMTIKIICTLTSSGRCRSMRDIATQRPCRNCDDWHFPRSANEALTRGGMQLCLPSLDQMSKLRDAEHSEVYVACSPRLSRYSKSTAQDGCA